MYKPFVVSGLGLLVAVAVVGSCGTPVAIKTGSLYPDADPATVGCYTSGVTGGALVTDSTSGTAILDGMTGQRAAVTWPIGWTGRWSWGQVSVINSRGDVVARTGTLVNLTGGYRFADDSFLACTAEPVL